MPAIAVNKPVLICLFSLTIASGFLVCKLTLITLSLGWQWNSSIIQKWNLKVTTWATHCELNIYLFSLCRPYHREKTGRVKKGKDDWKAALIFFWERGPEWGLTLKVQLQESHRIGTLQRVRADSGVMAAGNYGRFQQDQQAGRQWSSQHRWRYSHPLSSMKTSYDLETWAWNF